MSCEIILDSLKRFGVDIYNYKRAKYSNKEFFKEVDRAQELMISQFQRIYKNDKQY